MTALQFESYIAPNRFTKHKDNTYTVRGDVNLVNLDLKVLPVSFREVTGSFDCSQNHLVSLKGSPKKVGKNFNCSSNNLTSLEYSPEMVGGDFSCSFNRLSKIVGCTQQIGNNFECENNKLTSLQYGPQRVGGSYYCGYNKITNLAGSPLHIKGVFSCISNHLTSLANGPQLVDAAFICASNQLTTLDGCPQKVGNLFDCSHNKLNTLNGSPIGFNGDFNCSNNLLITLEGCPNNVTSFDCFKNNLTSLFGGPTTVKGIFNCHSNPLSSLEGCPTTVGNIFITSLKGVTNNLLRHVGFINEFHFVDFGGRLPKKLTKEISILILLRKKMTQFYRELKDIMKLMKNPYFRKMKENEAVRMTQKSLIFFEDLHFEFYYDQSIGFQLENVDVWIQMTMEQISTIIPLADFKVLKKGLIHTQQLFPESHRDISSAVFEKESSKQKFEGK